MHVLATAGHVDHGKSTLVRALTGTEPDRLAEERDRGLSIELGYCWTTLPGVGDVAFVDVPGHERFIATMLAGVGPIPAVLFVVAADDPWMPQAAEHLKALDALGVEHGVFVVSRSDLADPKPMIESVRSQIQNTTLGGSPVISASASTGEGLDDVRAALSELIARLPPSSSSGDVRLWLDRRFHVAGTGTVVTGTLPAGRIRIGDELAHEHGIVRVRGIQALEQPVQEVSGVARVALNLGSGAPKSVGRGSVLFSPNRWELTNTADVRVRLPPPGDGRLPKNPTLHVGAIALPCRMRRLGGDVVRLTLDRALPLRIGDRALLRDPGSRTIWGIVVLDPQPPPLRRRGAAEQRASDLAQHTGRPDAGVELRLRTAVRRTMLERLGVDTSEVSKVALVSGDWLLGRVHVDELHEQLQQIVRDHRHSQPLSPGMPVDAAARALGLPDAGLIKKLVRPPLQIAHGQIEVIGSSSLPPETAAALEHLQERLCGDPFAAPNAHELAEMGLDHKSVAAAAKRGLVLRLAETVVLLPGADTLAAERLAALPQPFTASQARIELATSRRVALPLLDHLDRIGATRRLPDDRRTVEF